MATPRERLNFYAARLSNVEEDDTHYALPALSDAADWLRVTPPEFVFNVKAFRAFTLHLTPLKALPAILRDAVARFSDQNANLRWLDLPPAQRELMWSTFRDTLLPLSQTGRLGYVLFEFPVWVMKNNRSLRHIAECAEQLQGYTLAIELRNRSWFAESNRAEVLAFLRERALPLVTVDQSPDVPGTGPAVWDATSSKLAVVRFLGRNRSGPSRRKVSAAERMNYVYSSEQLSEFIPRIRALAEHERDVDVIFANCYEDNAVRNALELRRGLRA